MTMLHALSVPGDAALGTVLQQHPLLAFDFDGTLVPIVDSPDAARVSPVVARRLASLGARLSVAVLSGRDVADLRQRLGFVPRYIVGNHGAEGDGLLPDQAQALPAQQQALDEARRQLERQREWLQRCGVTVEEKRCSLCLHYRRAPDRTAARQAIAQLLVSLGPGVRSFGGKLGVNLVATGAADKADAMQMLVARSGCGSALYVGDDVNDEPVFQRAAPHWMTIRVGRLRSTTQARFFLDSPRELGLLLARVQTLLL